MFQFDIEIYLLNKIYVKKLFIFLATPPCIPNGLNETVYVKGMDKT